MKDYYSEKLSSNRLKQCYDIAPKRVQQYLACEIEFILDNISLDYNVLELGCGYGRIIKELLPKAKTVFGIDSSFQSLQMAKDILGKRSNCHLLNMNALNLGFANDSFDLAVCVQNGLSAFKVDQRELISEVLRVTKPAGTALFSSYSAKFWDHRLEWFKIQSDHGLIGEIDFTRTTDGIIVCKDGFKATTISRNDFIALTSYIDATIRITEVDESSLFCAIKKVT